MCCRYEALFRKQKSETEKIKLWETAAQYAMEAIQLSGTSLPAMKADFFEKPEKIFRLYMETAFRFDCKQR